MESVFQARLIFGVIWAGSTYGFMFHVPQQFQKVSGYSNKEEYVNLLSKKAGNKRVKFCCSFHFQTKPFPVTELFIQQYSVLHCLFPILYIGM